VPTLLFLFLAPLISSALLFMLPATGRHLKILAFFLSLIPLGVLIVHHDQIVGAQINYPWLPQLGINFHLVVDNLSLVFLYLTAILVPISMLATPSEHVTYPNVFFGLILLLETLLIGFFTARDLALFTIFWESMLLPLYFIITLWGGPQRRMAALKFLIYMLAGSALMVAAVLALYAGAGTFDLGELAKVASSSKYAPYLAAIFLLAFAVKTPLFPFHAWLPDAYTQASTTGTILLAGLLSKAGIYGILRVGYELFPDFIVAWSPWLLGFAIAGVFYGGLAAWMENDYKRLIAYSSFSHVNFILVGLFIWNQQAHAGAILQAFNHGITITALFLAAGWLEQKLGSTSIKRVSGLAKYMPILCWLTLLFVLSNVALPGTNNFIGELLIFFGLFAQHPWLTAFLGLSVILSVIYMLRWMQKVYFEEPNANESQWTDIGFKELLISLPLVLLILWVGIYPSPILQRIEPAAEKIATANLEQS